MDIKKRIEKFNKYHLPFSIMDHGDGSDGIHSRYGRYGLSQTWHYRQEAFDEYAVSIGDSITENGMVTHGNGYEWEDVFKKAFENDPNLKKIDFDCEAGGFHIYADDYDILESFAIRFYEICNGGESFINLVKVALDEAMEREIENEKRIRREEFEARFGIGQLV